MNKKKTQKKYHNNITIIQYNKIKLHICIHYSESNGSNLICCKFRLKICTYGMPKWSL